jgi:hypothetical protein
MVAPVLLPPPKGEAAVLEAVLPPKPPYVVFALVALVLPPPKRPPEVLLPKAGLLPKPPLVFDPKAPEKKCQRGDPTRESKAVFRIRLAKQSKAMGISKTYLSKLQNHHRYCWRLR